jgi:hypothetical protein
MRLFPTRRRRHFTKIINLEMNPSNPLGLEHGVTEAGYSIILGLVLVESYVGAHVGAMEHDLGIEQNLANIENLHLNWRYMMLYSSQ